MQANHPDKQAVRDWLDQQSHSHDEPLPDLEEIRRQLGWKLLENNDSIAND